MATGTQATTSTTPSSSSWGSQPATKPADSTSTAIHTSLRPLLAKGEFSLEILPDVIKMIRTTPEIAETPLGQLVEALVNNPKALTAAQVASQSPPIKVGDDFPNVPLSAELRIGAKRKQVPYQTREVLAPFSVIFGLPGANTQVCDEQHITGFAEYAPKFNALGYTVFCVCPNDLDSAEAWKQKHGNPNITMFADYGKELIGKLGKRIDRAGDRALGTASMRFVLITVDGKVVEIIGEEKDNPGVCINTSAKRVYDIAEKVINEKKQRTVA